MASKLPAKPNEALIENGLEPEYLITDIVRAEPVSGNMMRLYLASKKHHALVLQFTVVGSMDDFARMAKQVIEMAASQHNLKLWEDLMDDGDSH